MTQVSDRLDALRAAISGPVIGPDDPDYDDARRVWNADIDRRPSVIARCLSAEDVAAAVIFATENDLEIAVRAGAHSVSGASVVDDGLMIDLSQMNHVTVDPATKRALVGGGALLGDLNSATAEHGLAVPAGAVSHTGVAGLTLGGGMGWLTRKHGLSIDNIVSATVVTADGRILRAAEDENPDLYWAIRGGGGNFGVVTEFDFQLHDVDPTVQFGLLFWGLDQGPDVLRLARDVIGSLHPELNIIIAGLNAPPAPFVPEEHQGQPGYALLITGFGAPEEHERVLARIRDELPPLWEFVSPLPYTFLNQLIDEPNAWGFHYYDSGMYLEDLTDEAIDVITKQVALKSSPLSVTLFYRLDQAYSDVGEDDTAFSGGRSPRYSMFIIAVCPTPDLLVADRGWVRAFAEAIRPHSARSSTYVNAMHDPDEDRVKAAYGAKKYERLAQIKTKYDPQNVFQRNANIKPG